MKLIALTFNLAKLRSRKGLDKPIFVVASLTLALMFLALYFTAVSGWLDQVVGGFNSAISDLG